MYYSRVLPALGKCNILQHNTRAALISNFLTLSPQRKSLTLKDVTVGPTAATIGL